MTSFFAQAKIYLVIGLLVALGIVSLMLASARTDLVIVNDKLDAAQAVVTVLEETNKVLLVDMGLKEDLNVRLAMKLAVVDESYISDLENLNVQIAQMEHERESATLVVNKIVYIKESFVDKASSTVLDTMWITYCKAKGSCT